MITSALPGAPGDAFDYSSVPAAAADTARTAAIRIRSQVRTIGQAIFTIGKELMAVKETLGHGNFGRWLEAEFQWNDRTAQRYMAAYTTLGPKSDTVSELPPTIL